jgi:polysaccharide biosynthesis PFTS motif protein
LLKKRKKVLKFKSKLKGFSLLKDQNKLGLWRDLKEQFLIKSPIKIKSCFSKFIFGSSFDHAEIIIHQYCVDVFLPNWLGGEILANVFNASDSKITKPLPLSWIKILEKENFILNKLRIRINFILFIIRKFAQNIRLIFSLIYRSIKLKPEGRIFQKNSVYFFGLNPKNFPPNLKFEYNFDIISWYLGSTIFKSETKTIYHNVIEKEDIFYKNIEIKYHQLPFTYVDGKSSNFKFIFWSILAIILAGIELLIGKWHHALILGEAAENKIVELKNLEELSKEYYFHFSGEFYRPMWTYGATQKGIEIVSYFYSTFEVPLNNERESNQKFEFYLYNWPISLVWDEAHSRLLKANSKFVINEKVVGPIFMNDSIGVIDKSSSFTIALFDIQRQKKSFQFGVSTLFEYHEHNENVHISFINDVLECAQNLNMIVHHKIKRQISSITLKTYLNNLNKIKFETNYITIDPEISAIKLIDSADLIISSPFTSTALYGRMRNKPSYYYDPTNWIQKNDPASHGIPIISGIEELSQVLRSFSNK